MAIAFEFGVTVGARSIVRDDGDPRLAVAVALIALNLATVAVVILFASRHGRPRAADFGLRRPPLARATGLVIAVLGATFALSAVWAVSVGIDEGAPAVTDRLAATSGRLNALLVLVLVAVATPLAEEFLFRGYFFRALRNWRGFSLAAVTSSAVFAAFHVGWSPIVLVVPAGLFGFGACLLYRWTGSLYPSLAMHAVLNSIGFAPAMGWTWQLPLAIGFSVATTMAIARLIALLLGEDSGPFAGRSDLTAPESGPRRRTTPSSPTSMTSAMAIAVPLPATTNAPGTILLGSAASPTKVQGAPVSYIVFQST